MTKEEIRMNWKLALKSQDFISSIIGWGFYLQDLIVLGALHKHGDFREKIEDLLEDCNFHRECSLLSDGKYDEYADYIFEEYKNFG